MKHQPLVQTRDPERAPNPIDTRRHPDRRSTILCPRRKVAEDPLQPFVDLEDKVVRGVRVCVEVLKNGLEASGDLDREEELGDLFGRPGGLARRMEGGGGTHDGVFRRRAIDELPSQEIPANEAASAHLPSRSLASSKRLTRHARSKAKASSPASAEQHTSSSPRSQTNPAPPALTHQPPLLLSST